MKPRRGRTFALLALCACALAAALGIAAPGRAATSRTCPPNTGTPTTSPCFAVTALPQTVDTGGQGGLLVATFTDLGNDPVYDVAFSAAALPPGAALGAVSSSPAKCTSLPCVFGQVAGHQQVTLFVAYTISATGSNPFDLTVSFVERRGSARSSYTVHGLAAVTGVTPGGPVGGACLTSGSVDVADDSGDAGSVFSTAPSGGLPCLPASMAIGSPLAALTSNSISVFVGAATQGYVRAELDFPVLPPGTTFEHVTLYELTDTGSTVTVGQCGANGLPTGGEGQSTDTCIDKRSPYGDGGAEFAIHVVGQDVDPRYGV